MGVDDRYRREFFSSQVTIMFDERSKKEGDLADSLAERLRTIGFSGIELVPCIPEFKAQTPQIYHKGDLIRGRRIGFFLEYAEQYANAA